MHARAITCVRCHVLHGAGSPIVWHSVHCKLIHGDAVGVFQCLGYMHYVISWRSWLTWMVAPCRYEGEFQAGYAHGLGQFTSELTGEIYIGEFFAGQRHG